MACCVIGTASLFSGFSFASQDSVDWLWILVAALGFFIQGLTEEVLTRGYLFNELASHLSRVWATLISALAFMGLHAANPGMTLMPVINLFVFGLVFALLFWLTDNIWLVGAAHSIWNFTLGPLLGIEVSGQVFPKTIFISQARADLPLINGGSFGVEASIFTTFFGLLACLYMVCLLRKRGEN
nr:CPBP family intramembrane glutamic endopeptidase [Streptococcus oricebi]